MAENRIQILIESATRNLDASRADIARLNQTLATIPAAAAPAAAALQNVVNGTSAAGARAQIAQLSAALSSIVPGAATEQIEALSNSINAIPSAEAAVQVKSLAQAIADLVPQATPGQVQALTQSVASLAPGATTAQVQALSQTIASLSPSATTAQVHALTQAIAAISPQAAAAAANVQGLTRAQALNASQSLVANNAILRLLDGLGASKLATTSSQIARLTAALATISPQAAAATAGIRGIAVAGVALGPLGIALAAIAAGVSALSFGVVGATRGVADIANQAELLENLHQKTGLVVGDLQALQAGFKASGVAPEALSQGLKFLNQSIAQSDPALRALNITTGDTREALFQLADAFEQSKDGPRKVAFATALLGRAGEDLIPILNQGRGALEAFIRRAEEIGISFSTGDLATLADVDAAFDDLTERVAALRKELLLTAAPAVLDLVENLSDLVGALNQVGESSETAGRLLASVLRARPGAEQIEALKSLPTLLDKARDSAAGLVRAIPNASLARGLSGLAEALDTEPVTKPVKSPETAAKEKPDLPRPPGGEESEREKQIKRIKALLGDTLGPAARVVDELQRIEDVGERLQILETLSFGVEITGEAEAFAENQQRLVALLGMTQEQASEAAQELARMADVAERLDFLDQLTLGPSITPEAEAFEGNVLRMISLLGMTREEAESAATAIANLAREQEALDIRQPLDPIGVANEGRVRDIDRELERLRNPKPIDLEVIRKEWELTVESMTSQAAILDATLNASLSSIQVGFQALAGAMVGEKVKIVDVVKSMVAEILAQLARLAAFKLFSVLLAPFTGGASLAAFPGGVMAQTPPTVAPPPIELESRTPPAPASLPQAVAPVAAREPAPELLAAALLPPPPAKAPVTREVSARPAQAPPTVPPRAAAAPATAPPAAAKAPPTLVPAAVAPATTPPKAVSAPATVAPAAAKAPQTLVPAAVAPATKPPASVSAPPTKPPTGAVAPATAPPRAATAPVTIGPGAVSAPATVAPRAATAPPTVVPAARAPGTVPPASVSAPATKPPGPASAPPTLRPSPAVAPGTVPPGPVRAPGTIPPLPVAATIVQPRAVSAPPTVAPAAAVAPPSVAPQPVAVTGRADPVRIATPSAAVAPRTVPPIAAVAPQTVAPVAARAPSTISPSAAKAPETAPPRAAAAPATIPPRPVTATIEKPGSVALPPIAPPRPAVAPGTVPPAAAVAPRTVPPPPVAVAPVPTVRIPVAQEAPRSAATPSPSAPAPQAPVAATVARPTALARPAEPRATPQPIANPGASQALGPIQALLAEMRRQVARALEIPRVAAAPLRLAAAAPLPALPAFNLRPIEAELRRTAEAVRLFQPQARRLELPRFQVAAPVASVSGGADRSASSAPTKVVHHHHYNNSFNIQAADAKSFGDQYRDPFGSIQQELDRQRKVGAA